MNWTPGQSTWFVNGAEVAGIKLQAPKDPSRILFIAWSDGGSWTGKMAVNDTAYLQIQWIEFVFNVTGTNDVNDRTRRLVPKPEGGPHSPPMRCDVDNGCKVVYSIDESGHVGETVMLWNGTIDGTRLATRHGLSTAFWLPALIVLTMALSSMSVL
ncbi:conserved hypothetical protein [Verticillium alfalfae VaMs.102]|uniref:GH16 domain-containing protein n=1 Tax=Verticillium alfalfae (strain VaMs.102 / ATCC MYA-4576 / FGSC 10136) TaxID=526221 RepID=C9SEA2_VERA1|nr:conserved hypothetical protein [Verticillium alfalfae VaMs.102]EEY16495.1 conserved hypothetical protein [Verticillium alfalfae VaMs.102]